MDGVELGRQVARMRAESRARTRLAVLWRSRSADAAATTADCVGSAKEPLRRFDALRRRPEQVPVAVRWPARPGGGGPLPGRR